MKKSSSSLYRPRARGSIAETYHFFGARLNKGGPQRAEQEMESTVYKKQYNTYTLHEYVKKLYQVLMG